MARDVYKEILGKFQQPGLRGFDHPRNGALHNQPPCASTTEPQPNLQHLGNMYNPNPQNGPAPGTGSRGR